MIVALDASPLSLLTQRSGVREADACRVWADTLVAGGVMLVVPAISDYEVRRELIRAAKTTSIARLDALRDNPAITYLPMTEAALTRAAVLWAEARNRGRPTADPAELDCDVVLVASLLTANLPPNEIVIATSNPGHLSQFLPAARWETITPAWSP
jgi:hypothetical protein